jgi:formylglycine-generating enzyme required for sulfatase activity
VKPFLLLKVLVREWGVEEQGELRDFQIKKYTIPAGRYANAIEAGGREQGEGKS